MADEAGEDDPVMARIFAAIERSHAGDSRGAREGFEAIWREMGPDADPFHRCTLAHYAADVQDSVRDELAWDVRALDAARQVSDTRAEQYHASLVSEGFPPRCT